jgi:hypothetical protein
VAKVAAAGTSLDYATYLGGSAWDVGSGIAVDGAGAAYVTGPTYSTNFPTASPFQVVNAGSSDVFVTKVSAAGTSLVYSTYLGGSGGEGDPNIAVDGSGAAYVAGVTSSTDFPTADPFQSNKAGGTDAFVTKVSAAGTSLVYSTYLGGSANDYGWGLAVDSGGAAYVAGKTDSSNFPTASPFQPAFPGENAFILKLPGSPDTLEFSASSYSVGEGQTATVTVTRAGSSSGTVSVDYATSDGTATAGADYTPASGTLTFPAGTTTQTFMVQTTADAAVQGDRSLNLTLSAPSGGASLGMIAQAQLTIVDGQAGTLEFESENLSVAENVGSQTATVTVSRVNGAFGAVTVEYATADDTATAAGNDYTPTSGTLTLADGVTSATFTVPIADDTLHEDDESLHLTLSNPTGGATLGDRSHALLTILDDDRNVAEFYTTDGSGGMSFLKVHTDWRASWDIIVPGNFGGDGRTDLLFYDRNAGHGEFYTTDGSGGITLLRQQPYWRTTWDIIVPGNFGGDGHTDLLFYDRETGTAQFYATDGGGGIHRLRTHTDWRTTWDLIVPGRFGGDGRTDLLFYDRETGYAEFYTTDGAGGITHLATHDNWRATWDMIIPGNFGGGSPTDLLFYDRETGFGEFYATDGHGGIVQLQAHDNWRASWDTIVPGSFGGDGRTDLFFYDRSARQGEFYRTDGLGGIAQLRLHDGLRATWFAIVPGNFGGDSPTDLLFYER